MSVTPKFAFKAEDIVKQGRTSWSKVEEIKTWLTLKTNIPPMSDEQIILFLIACNNIIENTENTIENYFKMKSSAPEFFTNRYIDSQEMKQSYSCAYKLYMPNRTKENYAVLIGALKDTTYYNFHLDSQIKGLLTVVELILYSNPPSGLIFIVSMKGVGLMHLTRLKLNSIKKFLGYVQEALPTQLKAVHVLHATYIFEKILMILKPFMKKELFDMIIAHPINTDMNDFFEKHVPANCIPSDFGGDMPSLKELTENVFKENRRLKTYIEMDEKQVELYKNEK